MTLEDLDLKYIKGEIKKFVLENYGKFPEYGNKVYLYASDKWFKLLPNKIRQNTAYLDFFRNRVYPILRKEMNIIKAEEPFYDTLCV